MKRSEIEKLVGVLREEAARIKAGTPEESTRFNYPTWFRDQVLEVCKKRLTYASASDTARDIGIGTSTVSNWVCADNEYMLMRNGVVTKYQPEPEPEGEEERISFLDNAKPKPRMRVVPTQEPEVTTLLAALIDALSSIEVEVKKK